MTTPNIDLLMPFSAVFAPASTAFAHSMFVAHGDPARTSGTKLYIPQAVLMVRVSWNGAQSVDIKYKPGEVGTQRTLHKIGSGTLYERRTVLLEIPVDRPGSELSFMVARPTQEEMDNCRLGVTVIPTAA